MNNKNEIKQNDKIVTDNQLIDKFKNIKLQDKNYDIFIEESVDPITGEENPNLIYNTTDTSRSPYNPHLNINPRPN